MGVLKQKVNAFAAFAENCGLVADFWLRQINTHGEQKAEEFYRLQGFNHLERKVDWEGLTLSREPKPHEALCIKDISRAQDSSRATIGRILLSLRSDLIDQGMRKIKQLSPAEYHSLTVEVPKQNRADLRAQAEQTFEAGRRLLATELSRQSGKSAQIKQTPAENAELDDLTDLTASRVANDVQARIAAAAARYSLLGLTGNELWNAVDDELRAGSVSYIDRSATGLANKLLNLGRSSEADDRSDEWDRVEYSAILDQNVCGPCSAADGETAASEDDLTPVPNPDCEGGDWCRCLHIFINQ